ncbi:AraC family transcriptional regulator [Cypionkella sp.]|uniref:AraC family transcriptional regulator n=1 Tax=Cypionkella sp. TaxID=2811411 RepID=UPI002722019F|nr:AraC family transcriptional regulator [Cypionkella sp.]MDO8983467.1 AraC family transcriptional regulator [Cypionkella sp.]MDP1577829.1 AraC family transcriptional regulator [Cypionkella sp.]MDP2048464.1 AraC family transcriptional regulator [Cypionkella sp.]
MKTTITTKGIDLAARSRHWHEAIGQAYFPLDLSFRRPEAFDGELSMWQLGEVSLSRLTSDALMYRRLPKHLQIQGPEEFLVTLPAKSELLFAQGGREVRANPGAFFIERSHEPYEFSHAEPADLWVMKLSLAMLGGRVRAPDRFCSLQFDATNGANGLFVDMVHLIPQRYDAMSEEARSMVGRQLADLLAMALQSDERVLSSGGSTVRMAHLARIESFVRRHIDNPDLGPDEVAAGCGVSVRYLHELLRDTNQTLGSWIRDQRLAAAREDLGNPRDKRAIGEIAYARGFADQAQFSRAFRQRYGITPKEARAQG